MYFDPYTLGFISGSLVTIAVLFLILLISAIVSVNRRNRK